MSDLLTAFEQTVAESKLIQPVDASLVEAGRTIAAQIDYAIENLSGQDVTKALYLTPHLVNILRELLASPASRRAAGIVEEVKRGKLASLSPIAKPQRSA
jgi:hypothetical protein